VFTLMPGSRQGEVDVMAPLFIAAARLIAKEVPGPTASGYAFLHPD
jgi:lipid-A-disaccharide synthase